MKEFLLQFFTWWNGQTIGTRYWTWRAGERVGTDEFGNTYYRQKGGDRRWVVYNGEAEASRIPAEWHGWMHKRTDIAPPDDTYKPREWEKPHIPNLTGTALAYRPPGSIVNSLPTQAEPDYPAWKPD